MCILYTPVNILGTPPLTLELRMCIELESYPAQVSPRMQHRSYMYAATHIG